MYRYLKIHGRMTEAEARGLFQQLVSALQHCHQRGIVHQDLKPLSLLFDFQHEYQTYRLWPQQQV